MPVLIAHTIRYLVVAALQIGSFTLAQQFLEKSFYEIRNFLISEEIMSGDEAEESFAAEILSAAAALGINAYLIKSRLPLRIADWIQKPLKKPSLSPTGSVQGGKALNAGQQARTKEFLGKKMLGALAISFATTIPWIPNLVQNFLDQGTFNPTAANAALRALGLGHIFQWPTTAGSLQPGTYTTSEFLELYDQLTAAGAVGLQSDWRQQSLLWSKEALSEHINYIVGTLILQGKSSDKTAIKKELEKYLVYRKPDGTTVTPAAATTAGGRPEIGARAPTQIQIYTGVVADGTLGLPSEFIARPDDMIQNTDELRAAAKNNLAAFVQSLPGRFYYEVAIVNSVKTQAGFTQKGAPVRVVTGYYKNGDPRYKTIYHKFAVMKVGVLGENGQPLKLGTITLGPVNVVDYQPSASDLQDTAGKINDELFTSDISDIKEIQTTAGAVVKTEPATPPPAPTPPPEKNVPVIHGGDPNTLKDYQRVVYDGLIKNGASQEVAFSAAELAPVPSSGGGASAKTTPSAPSTSSGSSSGVYSFSAESGKTYKVRASSESEARSKAASFAKEDKTKLKK